MTLNIAIQLKAFSIEHKKLLYDIHSKDEILNVCQQCKKAISKKKLETI